MMADDVDIWGDGSDLQGNDIERFTATACWQPQLRIYKPWLTRTSSRARRPAEMSAWLTARTCPTEELQEKAYSTDANILGATHEAKRLEHLGCHRDSSSRSWACVFWDPTVEIETEDVTVRFVAGRPVAINGRASPPWSCSARPTRSAGGTAWAWPTRSRTGSSRPRAAASTRRRAWRCFIAYERLRQRHPQRGHHRATTTPGPAARDGCCTRAAGWTPGADAARVAAALGRLGRSPARSRPPAPRRDYSIIGHHDGPPSYHPDKLSMERNDDGAFGPMDRIGQLTMRNLDIADTRSKLELYSAMGQLPERQAHLVGELEPGGAAVIAAAVSEATDEEVEDAEDAPDRARSTSALTEARRMPVGPGLSVAQAR